jgi:hypothetical protein
MSLAVMRAALKSSLGTPTLVAGGYTLTIATRVKLGHVRFASTTEFQKTIVSAGPYLVIHGGSLDGWDSGSKKGNYSIQATLWLGIAKDTDDDLTNAEALLAAIKGRWTNTANFTGTGTHSPNEISWGAPILGDIAPILVQYQISTRFVAC